MRGTQSRRSRQPVAASLEGFYRHFNLADCLMFVARELGRLGIDKYDLPPYQRELLNDLSEGLDEEALAKMQDYWGYDLRALVARGKDRHRPAKPRIDVEIEITSKGNFKVEWFPRGWNLLESSIETIGCDFLDWRRREHRHIRFDSRPSNELLFIHHVQGAIGLLKPSGYGDHPTRVLNHVLLAGCTALLDDLKYRLTRHFEVRWLNEVFVEWDEPKSSPREYEDQPPPTIVTWIIDDPERRRIEAEQLELKQLTQRHGFSKQQLLKAIKIETTKKPTGPAPSDHTLADRIARTLKREGLPATRGKVERALELLRKHEGPSNVIPLGHAKDTDFPS